MVDKIKVCDFWLFFTSLDYSPYRGLSIERGFKVLLIFWIKSKPVVSYRSSVFFKKICSFAFKSSKNKEITLPHEFIFVFIWYFNWSNIVRKVLPKVVGSEKCKRVGGRVNLRGHDL